MNKRLGITTLVATLGVSLVFCLGRLSADNEHFSAHLSGNEEVPPVNSQAQGQVLLQLESDGLHFKLIVANIENVTAAHLHLAQPGMNGPIVAFLFPGPTTDSKTQGVLAQGVITAANLVGPLRDQPLSELIAAIQAGNVYANVHTTEFPGGEIRGQVR